MSTNVTNIYVPIYCDLLPEHCDENQEIARSSFGDMLHDTERNQKYNDALKLAIDKMHSNGRKAKVLDIGTGSGLLSMMAVNCGADSVVACESFIPISNCAREVLRVNGYIDKIKVISKHSTKLTVGDDGDLTEKANILVAEVFDTELIGEGALRAFRHACEKLLESDCIVVPSFATVYAQVVECSTAQDWNKCNNLYDVDHGCLLQTPESIFECAGAAAVHDLQLSQLSTDLFRSLCAPQVVFDFDWTGKTPILFSERKRVKVIAENTGIAQVIFMWWELAMDPDKTITLSCAPYWAHPLKNSNPNLTSADIPWRDHWLQAIYYPLTEIAVTKGEEFNVVSCHDEFSLWFDLEAYPNLLKEYKAPICTCGLHCMHSRTRIGQINDYMRRNKYLSFLKNHVTNESVILVISDGFYLGLSAAKLGAKKLLFIDSCNMSTHVLKDYIITNNITNCEVLDGIDALEMHPNTKDITLILGEPHFFSSILPWDNVLFANMVKHAKQYIKQDVIVAPKECVIKGMMVEFINLQKTQLPVEVCGEFNMKPFDDVIQSACKASDSKIDAQPLWEYPCLPKSSPKILARLNMYDIDSSPVTSFTNVLTTEGTNKNYNAIAFWTEWDLDGTAENVITTGPVVPPVLGKSIQWDMHTRQGVSFVQPKILSEFYFCFTFYVKSCTATLQFC